MQALAVGLALAAAAMPSVAAPVTHAQPGVVGWRTDGTGRYPSCTPPLSWSPTENVAWATAMPGSSAATPVIVGERIFVLADPFLLLCVNKSDGHILWQRTNDLNRVVGPDGLAEFRTRCGEWFEAGIERLDRLIERERIARRLMDLPADDPAEQRRLAALDGEVKRLDERIAALPEFRLESRPGGWRIGYTCCTPVSDGHGVFALFGNGVAVMYDLDGRLRWARFVRNRVKGYGQSMSPAWVGDTIGVHMDDEFYALDARTGRTRWVRYELQHEGSPAGMRVGDLDVFVINDGNVRAATNGAVVARLGLMRFHTPIVERDGTVWYVDNDRSLVGARLESDGQGGVAVRRMGGGPAPGKIYWSSPLIHEGLAYLWEGEENTIHVVDLKTRDLVWSHKLGLGAAYVSPAAAGRFVFVAGESGGCAVIENGWKTVELGPNQSKRIRDFRVLGVNRLDGFWACPVFEGDRMYVRTFAKLYCFRASEADKRRAAPPVAADASGRKSDAEALDALGEL
jgi:hypothetical protein